MNTNSWNLLCAQTGIFLKAWLGLGEGLDLVKSTIFTCTQPGNFAWFVYYKFSLKIPGCAHTSSIYDFVNIPVINPIKYCKTTS